MKLVRGLSSIVLISFLSTTPCFALNPLSSNLPNQSLSNQPRATKLAGFFDSADKLLNTVERERRRQERRKAREMARRKREEQRKARERARQERLEAARKRREKYEAARRAATERQRLEAERRRQYFESLSPEEKKAYLAQQYARQEAAAKLLILMLGASMSDSGSGMSSGDSHTGIIMRDRDRTYRPAPQPVPRPVKPISPFYGNGPKY
ncbi:hypothetical protein [Mastigocoleus testarum]|uniref:Uncharacterized protein n=1 Tax=Mastigocoleus testarum BC008 TaxID=371196 RepID=A0A0V7ZNM2_9CYAN|nr:hypothetical protein [Mastigocoleus testarum]KST66173.1 hypothetical protein BC008_24690 [Mastigocoleus testarum BC008]